MLHRLTLVLLCFAVLLGMVSRPTQAAPAGANAPLSQLTNITGPATQLNDTYEVRVPVVTRASVGNVAAATTYAADTFTRSVSNGWGSAESGGAYTLDGVASEFAVSNGVGHITVPAANRIRTAYLTGVTARNVDATVRVKTDKLGTGNGHMAYLSARRLNNGNEYLGRLLVEADGSIKLTAYKVINGTATALGSEKVVAGLAYSANTFVWLRMQVESTYPTTLRLKAWAAGQAEPTTWLVSVTDSETSLQTAGAVGLRSYVSATSTNAPITFTFDDFRIKQLGSTTTVPTSTPVPPTATATATPAPPTATATTTPVPQTATATATATPTRVPPTATPTSVPPTATATATPVPTTPSVYWGAYMPGIPWDRSRWDTLEAQLGKRMSLIQFGHAWADRDGTMQPFPTGAMASIRTRGAIPVVNWGSWQLGLGVQQPNYRLHTIAQGQYDAYITQWARAAKAWGQPFFLKLDHEMNGWWQFSWSEQLNGNQPGDYVAMWRHVHDIFEREGATNATWVWCPNITSARATPLAAVYPGDAYVDWTCMHGYNFGGTQWESFREVFTGERVRPSYNTYQQLLALAPNKPIMLGEWASAEAGDGGTKKAAWIRDALTVQIPKNFPQIRAVIWQNWNTEPGRTWMLDSSPAVSTAFREAIAAPVYASNQFATLSTSPIPPLRK